MMERRKFIKNSALGTCALLGGTSILLSACASLPLVKVKGNDKVLTIKASEFLTGNKILVRNNQLEFDILLHKLNDSEYRAIYLKCTHQEQPLTVGVGQLSCASHGSTFDMEGKVIKAPAKQDLLKFKTSVSDDNQIITINI
jgi:Rieske Fe-S protein